jgi:HEAT repeat protein
MRMTALVTALSVSLAFSTLPVWAQGEPFWNSRPLSYWLSALGEGPPETRVEAARGLSAIAMQHGGRVIDAALPALSASLAADDPALRSAAASALGQMGPLAEGAVDELLAIFENDRVDAVRRQAGLALTRVAPDAASVITAAARVMATDGDATVRQAAAAVLVQARAAAAPVAAAIATAAAWDRDPMVRVFACAAEAQLGRIPTAVKGLIAGLEDDDPGVRAEAAGFLGAIVPAQASAVPPLTEALSDPEPIVRLAAVEALAMVGRPARPAIPTLWHLMRDPDESVRDSAVRAIHVIRD